MAKKKRKPRFKPITVTQAKAEIKKRWDVLTEQRVAAETALDKYREELMARPDVHGMHVGVKRIKDKMVSPITFCIRIHVQTKLKKGHPRLIHPLPVELDGISVDIWESSYQLLGGDPADDYHQTLAGGIPFVWEGDPGNYGTLGIRVTSNNQPMMLTNRHVVGDKGNVVIQPPSKKVPSGSAVVGKVKRAVINSTVDCAIVEPDKNLVGPGKERQLIDGIKNGTSMLPGNFEIGQLDFRDQLFRTKVFKIGAVTGRRDGRVKTIAGSVLIPGQGFSISQIIVDSSSSSRIVQGGDSGSLLIKQETIGGNVVNRIVGLVTAEVNGGRSLVASHFSNVASALGIELP